MRVRHWTSACALAALAGTAFAQNEKPPNDPPPNVTLQPEHLVWEAQRLGTLYETGEEVKIDICRVWHAACGSKEVLTEDDLIKINDDHDKLMAGEVVIVTGDDPGTDSGFHITYIVSGAIPTGAIPAIQAAATYLNGKFPDTMNVTVNLSFAVLPAGVLGATTPTFAMNIPYSTSRSGLVAGRGDDTVMTYLPTPTIPVRYTTTVTTAENRVIWTTASYRSTIGNVSGADANMQLSSTFPWDYDPSNGVTAGYYSFRDVLIHETGHALGFISAVDRAAFANDITAMDIFRFRWVDYPWAYADFTARARWRVIDNGDPYFKHFPVWGPYQPIPVEDGYPYQASHLRSGWGIMGPALAPGQTYWPTYFNMQATTVFDYLGYDFPGPVY